MTTGVRAARVVAVDGAALALGAGLGAVASSTGPFPAEWIVHSGDVTTLVAWPVGTVAGVAAAVAAARYGRLGPCAVLAVVLLFLHRAALAGPVRSVDAVGLSVAAFGLALAGVSAAAVTSRRSTALLLSGLALSLVATEQYRNRFVLFPKNGEVILPGEPWLQPNLTPWWALACCAIGVLVLGMSSRTDPPAPGRLPLTPVLWFALAQFAAAPLILIRTTPSVAHASAALASALGLVAAWWVCRATCVPGPWWWFAFPGVALTWVTAVATVSHPVLALVCTPALVAWVAVVAFRASTPSARATLAALLVAAPLWWFTVSEYVTTPPAGRRYADYLPVTETGSFTAAAQVQALAAVVCLLAGLVALVVGRVATGRRARSRFRDHPEV